MHKIMKRPPSQSSKNSKNSGGGFKKKPPTNFKKQNPMISLTGGNQNRKMNMNGDKEQEADNQLEPDNEYLETMKLRMGAHLPTNTSG